MTLGQSVRGKEEAHQTAAPVIDTATTERGFGPLGHDIFGDGPEVIPV